MTVIEQIKALKNVGCQDAIQEIRHNHNRPLSSARLNHHIEIAINTGLVARVVTLAELGGITLTPLQVDHLTKQCLKLEWFVDALSAAKLGTVSEQTRDELIAALVSHQLANDREEVLRLLAESE